MDLSLDLNKLSPNYRDLLVINGDLVLTSDAPNAPQGATNPVLQDVLQRINFFLGEWFLDNTQGVPWFQQILVKNPDQAKIDALILNTILGTPGILTVTSYSFTPNFAQRTLTVSFSAQATSGPIDYTGTAGA